MKLSVLHFSTADNEGGSARSAYRIHSGLRQKGHESKMLVGKKVTNDSDVFTVHGGVFGKGLDVFTEYVSRLIGHQYLYVPSSSKLLAHPLVEKADIFQLYNTHGGYFSHKILPALSKKAPIVWRLSDMWPMTAHSAYTYSCECFKHGPENCLCDPKAYPPIYRNTTKFLWDVKEKIYSQSDITIVAPSKWIESAAKESILLSRFTVRRIPNGINLSTFHPRDRNEARSKFGIDPKANVLLFSAHGLDNNPRKGSAVLIEALNRLGRRDNTILLLAGEGGGSFADSLPIPVKKLGYVKDPGQMALVYSSADIMLVPSIVENLPNNLLEAMACGVPAVAFDAGGISDAVKHMKTGYLTQSADAEGFSRGIEELLGNKSLREGMSAESLKLIKEEFDQEKESAAFEELYRELIIKRKTENDGV